MSAIKKFFERKKLDIKFKQAGSGYKLTEDTSRKAEVSASPSVAGSGKLTDERKAAAEAAMARVNAKKNAPQNSIVAKVQREMLEEQKRLEQNNAMSCSKEAKDVYITSVPTQATGGVFFKCPTAGPAVLPKAEMDKYIEKFLLEQLEEEPVMASILMIYTLNMNKETVERGIAVLQKYLENVISNPGEEKYCKIRLNNKAFQERVVPLRGGEELLQAIGFEQKMLVGQHEIEEMHYVLNVEKSKQTDYLHEQLDLLKNGSPLLAELDRNVRVFHSSSKATRIEVPEEFYEVSLSELKREQQMRAEANERLSLLRTKEMREKDALRECRRYRYSLVRVRFPDGHLVQGTFSATETFSNVLTFLQELLEHDWMPFNLVTQTGQRVIEHHLSLSALGLAPASLLNFMWDTQVESELPVEQLELLRQYLKPNVLAMAEDLK